LLSKKRKIEYKEELAEENVDYFKNYSEKKIFNDDNDDDSMLAEDFKNYYKLHIINANKAITHIKKGVFELVCIIFNSVTYKETQLQDFPVVHEKLIFEFYKKRIGTVEKNIRRYIYTFVEAFYVGYINTCLKFNIDNNLKNKFNLEDFGVNQHFLEKSHIGNYIKMSNYKATELAGLIIVVQNKLQQYANKAFDKKISSDFKLKKQEMKNFLGNKSSTFISVIRLVRDMEQLRKKKSNKLQLI
jgi:hypothetical protein